MKGVNTPVHGRELQVCHGFLVDYAHGRLLAENTTLKQKVRHLTDETRTLNERLQAARSNGRFADRRIAELEAQLLERLGS
ncbi:hypothetical protein [Nonomuraea sp. KM90]|uniref:hypothetical protein n=1 Tax=Nonomuraea sp. KM90 TaxID=3457428 RepID=UPI003FCE5F78